MSPAFPAAVGGSFSDTTVTVDRLRVVQLFTKAVDEVPKAKYRLVRMPAATHWSVLVVHDRSRLTDKQAIILAELEAGDFLTAKAWQIREKLCWVRRAETLHAVRCRLSHFLSHTHERIVHGLLLRAVAKIPEDV